MAATIHFSGQALGQRFCSRAGGGITFNPLSSKVSYQLKRNAMKIEQQGSFMRRESKCKPLVIASSMADGDFEPSPISASDTIREFYACINKKNLNQLNTYFSDDCWFEDCSFPKPFQGRKEVMNFFEKLVTSMGQNVKFSVEHVCEGDEFTAGVNWHLEWKNTQVPFTRGCSFYECSIEGERLLIKKARVVIESPIKPGGIVLTLFKNVTSLFDDFPKAAEWFLSSPHKILQLLCFTMVPAMGERQTAKRMGEGWWPAESYRILALYRIKK
ncbi:Nuclear transport factor 2 (NTF2) family protein [Melia azedarach]|uniref:Nuclear transport factor 2 (NTF2) family protein n=1 Tax=Melia azedarach TaxID=155640 RepID=A0ACC1XL24_MELAZ|nr:Nuclear transport factor 2 (NTF2) family protein [Melia azedarach]